MGQESHFKEQHAINKRREGIRVDGYIYFGGGGTCATSCVRKSEDSLWEKLGLGDGAWVTRPDSQRLYLELRQLLWLSKIVLTFLTWECFPKVQACMGLGGGAMKMRFFFQNQEWKGAKLIIN